MPDKQIPRVVAQATAYYVHKATERRTKTQVEKLTRVVKTEEGYEYEYSTDHDAMGVRKWCTASRPDSDVFALLLESASLGGARVAGPYPDDWEHDDCLDVLCKRPYAVVPGYVTSKTDGQKHWITAQALMQLYGVSPKECYIVTETEVPYIPPGCIVLYPKYDGDYTLPGESK